MNMVSEASVFQIYILLLLDKERNKSDLRSKLFKINFT